MKKIKINVPEGYEIDRELSTLEEIVFKKIGPPPLSKSWEELGEIVGYHIDSFSCVQKSEFFWDCNNSNRNLFATEEQARASIALAQLTQLREVYRGGWKPDWEDMNNKYVIRKTHNSFQIDFFKSTPHFLAFQSGEIRDEFLKNFRDLIEEASLLLFG